MDTIKIQSLLVAIFVVIGTSLHCDFRFVKPALSSNLSCSNSTINCERFDYSSPDEFIESFENYLIQWKLRADIRLEEILNVADFTTRNGDVKTKNQLIAIVEQDPYEIFAAIRTAIELNISREGRFEIEQSFLRTMFPATRGEIFHIKIDLLS